MQVGDGEAGEQHEREQEQRRREVAVQTCSDDLTADAADEEAPLANSRACEVSPTSRQSEPDRESHGDSRQRQDHGNERNKPALRSRGWPTKLCCTTCPAGSPRSRSIDRVGGTRCRGRL